MYKALVLGCGNIGALYDFENDQVLTHAKALFLHPEFEFRVYDPDKSHSGKVSLRYHAGVINEIEKEDFSSYDLISICSPTMTHFHFLEKALNSNVKVIICEKPLSNDPEEIEKSVQLYKKSESKVIVNYMRRFQKSFIDLKKFISNIPGNDLLTGISVRYQKGFINNCSHALDLVQFLTGKEINLERIKKGKFFYDYFDTDPTVSMIADWDSVTLSLLGLPDSGYSFFEIDLFFQFHRISINSAGQNIFIYRTSGDKKNLQPLVLQEDLSSENCIKDYMKPVIVHACSLLKNPELEDNFLTAANLNKNMLNYLKN